MDRFLLILLSICVFVAPIINASIVIDDDVFDEDSEEEEEPSEDIEDPLAGIPEDVENFLETFDRHRCMASLFCYVMALPDSFGSGPFTDKVKASFLLQRPVPNPARYVGGRRAKYSDWLRYGIYLGRETNDPDQCRNLAPHCRQSPERMMRHADKIFKNFLN